MARKLHIRMSSVVGRADRLVMRSTEVHRTGDKAMKPSALATRSQFQLT